MRGGRESSVNETTATPDPGRASVTDGLFDRQQPAERAVAAVEEMRSLQETGGSEVPRNPRGPRRKHAPPTPSREGLYTTLGRSLERPQVIADESGFRRQIRSGDMPP